MKPLNEERRRLEPNRRGKGAKISKTGTELSETVLQMEVFCFIFSPGGLKSHAEVFLYHKTQSAAEADGKVAVTAVTAVRAEHKVLT